MRKGIANRMKALLLTVVMAVGVLAAVPAGKVEAGNEGTVYINMYEYTASEQSKSYLIYTNDTETSEKLNPPSGTSYDKATNTLTLNNVSMENATLSISGAGTDFKINVKGNNALKCISVWLGGSRTGNKNVFTITGDGTLVINKVKGESSGIVLWEDDEDIIHIDKYVNLTIYPGMRKDFLSYDENGNPVYGEPYAGPVIENGYTTVTDAKSAIVIDGDISGKAEYKTDDGVKADPEYLNIVIASDINASMPLYVNKYGGYYSFEESGTTSDEEEKTYKLYRISFGASNTFILSDGGTYTDSSLATEYTRVTSRPETFPDFAKTTSGDGGINITGIKVTNTRGYNACKNGNTTYGYISSSRSERDPDTGAYKYIPVWKIYAAPAAAAALEDAEWGKIYTSSQDFTEFTQFDQSTEEFANDYEQINHDLKAKGYTPLFENVFFTYYLFADPLVVTAKPKPAAAINIASDSITKTEGDAAFSLGATTDAGAKLTYASDNEAAAKVAADGQVTLGAVGTAKITITAEGDDFTTSTKVVTITVNAKPEEKTVEKGAATTDDKTGATYTVTESADGKVEVEYKASSSSKDKKVTIPSTVMVNGVEATVTSIADNAFSGNKTITDVTIPATIEEIGDNAFKNCIKLKKVTLPKSVEEIGKNAFAGCSSLTTVTIKSTTITKIDQGAFKNCKKLKKITITKNVTTIGKEAFSGDKKLKTITITSTKLKSVGKNAFKNVPKSTTIKVPKKQKKAYTKLLKKGGFKGKVK